MNSKDRQPSVWNALDEREIFSRPVNRVNRSPTISMNCAIVGQASRLPLGRLAPAFVAGETPAQAAGMAAPLPTAQFRRQPTTSCVLGAVVR